MKVRALEDRHPLVKGEVYEATEDGPYFEVYKNGQHLGGFSKQRFEIVPPDDCRALAPLLPTDSAARKAIPLSSGVLDYFPSALIEVAKLSKIGNDKHNPGQPLHHARGKSTDHADALQRHQLERDSIDPDTGLLHAVEVAWRALAQLQELLEARGAPKARGAK